MAEVTAEKLLQDALVGMIDGAGLVVGGRGVTVFDFLPEQAFTQKSLPVVVVSRPVLVEESAWTNDYVRRVYDVAIEVFDVQGVRPGDENEVAERLSLLMDKVKKVFMGEGNGNLRLAYLHVFYSMCSWGNPDDPFMSGNNVSGFSQVLSVPMTLEKGVVLDDGS